METGAKITGQEADDLYSPLEPLRAVGADLVYLGEVENKLLGDHRDWDRVAVVLTSNTRQENHLIDMQRRRC